MPWFSQSRCSLAYLIDADCQTNKKPWPIVKNNLGKLWNQPKIIIGQFHLSAQMESGLPLLRPSSVSPYCLIWLINEVCRFSQLPSTEKNYRFLPPFTRSFWYKKKADPALMIGNLVKIGRRFKAALCPPRKHHNLALSNSAQCTIITIDDWKKATHLRKMPMPAPHLWACAVHAPTLWPSSSACLEGKKLYYRKRTLFISKNSFQH